jgi:UDP-N-acetylglucosamine--N-acetylmuramyl-(pentapeptide) pyrophosphoryl-undecaprenol N-acetylglucosamine transferase
VGEALVAAGIDRSDISFVGGSRLEATVFPEAGFPFLEVELRGLVRSFDMRNLAIPGVVAKAVISMRRHFAERAVGSVLGMGGYVTVPAAVAARTAGATLFVAEQNAHAGLANRLASRLAARAFGAFPHTEGIAKADFVGNPVRRLIAEFDRDRLRPVARDRYHLPPDVPVLGVFGGSLGAGVLNQAVSDTLSKWSGPPLAAVHLAGEEHAAGIRTSAGEAVRRWEVLAFEDRMDLFFAACDLVLSRAGGAVAELTATGTPAVLVPGGFGSSGHQRANAAALVDSGAAVVLEEEELGGLGSVLERLLFDTEKLGEMRSAAAAMARPDAAAVVARAMIDAHG